MNKVYPIVRPKIILSNGKLGNKFVVGGYQVPVIDMDRSDVDISSENYEMGVIRIEIPARLVDIVYKELENEK